MISFNFIKINAWLKISGLIFIFLIILSYLRLPLWPDHTLYLYIGNCWKEGFLPYSDLFDQNWPGIIWISQAISMVTGPTPFGVRVFDLIWQSLTAVTLFVIARRNLNFSRSISCVFLYLSLYLAASFGSTAQREGFASLFLGIALILIRLNTARMRWLFLWMSGVLVAFACFIKPTFLILASFVTIYLFITRKREGIKLLVVFLFGLILPFGAYLSYLIKTGTFASFIDATVIFTMKYADLQMGWILRRFLVFLFLYPPGRLIILCVVMTALVLRKRLAWFKENQLVAIFALGTLLGLLIQRRLAYYHAMSFCFFGSIFLITAFKELESDLEKLMKGAFLKKLPVILILFILIFPIGYDLPASMFSILSGKSAQAHGDSQRERRRLAPWSIVESVGKEIQAKTPAGTRVLCIMGSESPDYYLAAKRMPVQKYILPAHFGFDSKRENEAVRIIEGTYEDIVLIVDSSSSKDSGLYQAVLRNKKSELISNFSYGDSASVYVYYLKNI